MPTNSYTTQKGYAALIGLIIAILLIAVLAYGGSFFSKKEGKAQIQRYNDIKVEAKGDLDGVNQITKQQQKEIDQ